MIAEAFDIAFQEIIKHRLRNTAQRARVSSAVMDVFLDLRKKSVEHLDTRINEVHDRIKKMAEDFSIEFKADKWVVTATGSSEALLKEFRFGSDWFEPYPDIDKVIVAAVFTDPAK